MANDSAFPSTSYSKYSTQDNSQNTKKNNLAVDLSSWSIWFQNYLSERKKSERRENPQFSTKNSRSSDLGSEWVSHALLIAAIQHQPEPISLLAKWKKGPFTEPSSPTLSLYTTTGDLSTSAVALQWQEASQMDVFSTQQLTASKNHQDNFKTN